MRTRTAVAVGILAAAFAASAASKGGHQAKPSAPAIPVAEPVGLELDVWRDKDDAKLVHCTAKFSMLRNGEVIGAPSIVTEIGQEARIKGGVAGADGSAFETDLKVLVKDGSQAVVEGLVTKGGQKVFWQKTTLTL